MTATDNDDTTADKGTVSECPTAAEVLHDLADHAAADLHGFADAVESGDADTDDYWYLVRGLAETFPAIEDAAETGAGLDAYTPHAHAVCEAFGAIHHLTYPDRSGDGIAGLRAALDDLNRVRNYRTVTINPQRVQAYVGRERLDDELSDRTLNLHDTGGGVAIATEGADPHADADAEVWGGSLAELDAEQARLLADALYQAADEMDGDRA